MNINKPNRLPKRTGLFGGTFNPIHIGHRQVAMDVLAQYGLDRIYFIPSAQPPHKTGGLAPARDRLEMVRLALGNSSALQASSVEIDREGPSYSLDTVLDFKAGLPRNGRLYFLVGVDAFMEIHSWKKYAELFEHTAFIVMSRPPDAVMSPAFIEKAEKYIQNTISKDYALAADRRTLTHPEKQPIHFSTVTPMDIAATRLRHMLRQKQPIDIWVAPAVAEYIQQKGLYR